MILDALRCSKMHLDALRFISQVFWSPKGGLPNEKLEKYMMNSSHSEASIICLPAKKTERQEDRMIFSYCAVYVFLFGLFSFSFSSTSNICLDPSYVGWDPVKQWSSQDYDKMFDSHEYFKLDLEEHILNLNLNKAMAKWSSTQL